MRCGRQAARPQQKNERNPIHHAVTSVDLSQNWRHIAITVPSHVTACDEVGERATAHALRPEARVRDQVNKVQVAARRGRSRTNKYRTLHLASQLPSRRNRETNMACKKD